MRNKCVNPCSSGVCGYRALCEVRNHRATCICPNPLTGNPFSYCTDVRQPPPPPEPIVDPCNPSPCGINAQCTSRPGSRHATCSCPPHLQYGSPYVECKPECVLNSDCPSHLACVSQRCTDPCPGACGANALCRAVNHFAQCYCPPGMEGDARIRCRERVIVQPPKPRPECEVDQECPNDKQCIRNKCQDACLNTICAPNADCKGVNHRAVCSCREGETGNPYTRCYPIGCRSDSECQYDQACINKDCVNPCLYDKCGVNAECRPSAHKAQCYCPERFYGNPRIRCERPQCVSDEECPYYLACINEKCADPCKCAPEAKCTVFNHRPNCECPPGTTGNPTVKCLQVIVQEVKYECQVDGDCPSKLACIEHHCRDPCLYGKPCGINAICSVQDTLPNRLMTCQCLPGYIGNARVECRIRKF